MNVDLNRARQDIETTQNLLERALKQISDGRI